ncbi:MAG TPA: hypothetical protein VGM92_07670 [Candidatus Kapabacteria bacterium]
MNKLISTRAFLLLATALPAQTTNTFPCPSSGKVRIGTGASPPAEGEIFFPLRTGNGQYFETHTNNPGFWPVHGRPAAHHLLDYVKIWDIPRNVTIPDYPHEERNKL